MKNTAFMGSIVVSGRGKAIVTETGMNTKIGQICKYDNLRTKHQKRLYRKS